MPRFPSHMLHQGDKGFLVRRVQRYLNELGAKLDVTGEYNALTAAAVRAWKKKRGMPGGDNGDLSSSEFIRLATEAWRHRVRHPDTKPPVKYPVDGCDYAWQELDVDALDNAGIQFVMRYLSHSPSKNLSADELDVLRNADMQVGLVWETTAGRALDGYAAGAADAKAAQQQLVALGLSASQPLCFAVDFQPTSAQSGAVLNYFAGAASVHGEANTGIYGGLDAVRAVLRSGHAKHAWQTYAWSRGQWEAKAAIRQVKNGVKIGGMTVDLDEQHAPTSLLFA